jgi:hypothetical protein
MKQTITQDFPTHFAANAAVEEARAFCKAFGLTYERNIEVLDVHGNPYGSKGTQSMPVVRCTLTLERTQDPYIGSPLPTDEEYALLCVDTQLDMLLEEIQWADLGERDLSPDEKKRAMEPVICFHAQNREAVDAYECAHGLVSTESSRREWAKNMFSAHGYDSYSVAQKLLRS